MSDIYYKGFVESKNKKCIEKFKNRTDFKTFEQVQSLPEYAGVLADNVIMVDVDDKGQSDILLRIVKELKIKCRVYGTERGKHFVFLNNGVKSCTGSKTHILAVGLNKVDVKVGCKNSYEVLKMDGKARRVLYDSEDTAPMPRWLIPVKSTVNFFDLGEGDGRNSTLFSYILTLQSAGLDIEECRECIRLLNRFVLQEPLDDNELEVILRDEAFALPSFYNGNAFLFDKFARHLVTNSHVKRIEGQLHLYRDGVYVAGKRYLENEMLRLLPEMNRAKRTEVYEYLDKLIVENTQSIDANLIAFRNGIYDLGAGVLMPFSPEHIIINRIPWDYNPNAYSELADNVLNKISCNNKQIRTLLEEVIGYCFYRRNELGKAFILIGDKSNGKSTYLNMVKNVLGEDNISALDLAEVNEKFMKAEIFGKLANIGDDIGDEFIPNTGVFKKLVTGDEISGERKGQDPFKFHSYAKLLFSANNIPRMGRGKDSAAIRRRLIIIPFEAQFSPNDADYDPYIKYKLRDAEVMEYLIRLGIDAWQQVNVQKEFTESDAVRSALDEYEKQSNPILGFFEELKENNMSIENEPTKDIYLLYQKYCGRSNLQALSNIEFSKQVNKFFGTKTKNKRIKGEVFTIFVKVGDDGE